MVSPQAESGNGRRGRAEAFRLAEKDFPHQVNVVVFADLGEAIAVEEEVEVVAINVLLAVSLKMAEHQLCASARGSLKIGSR
jgi:hypothetical protein